MEYIEIIDEGETVRVRGFVTIKDDGSIQKKIDELFKDEVR